MKRIAIAAAVTAAMLSAPALALPGHDHGHGHDKHRGHDRVRYVEVRHHDGRHDNGLHLGQRKHAWRRGERIERVYLAPRYYVTDYRTYRLAPPPRGYAWVRPSPDSNEFLMVQVATGIISQILGY